MHLIKVRGLCLALVVGLISPVANAANFGGFFFLSIRDCTGVAPLDSCIYPDALGGEQNFPILRDFRFSITDSASGKIELPGFGSAEGGVAFGGELDTPTLTNKVVTSAVSRNGVTLEGIQSLTFTGTAPTVVPFGGEFTYTSSGTFNETCGRVKIVNDIAQPYSIDQCGGINISLDVRDADTGDLLGSEFRQSGNGAIPSPEVIQIDVELVPGKTYEVRASVQTTARGAGQEIDSLNSFEVGVVDPDTGGVTKDVPPSLPALEETLVPASEDNQPGDIEIDVLPGDADNDIRIGRGGVIPVAILTTPEFYAPDVDRDSLGFGPGGAAVAVPGGGPKDVDGDGDMDYVVHFRARDAALTCSDDTAYLSGTTTSGDIIVGGDAISPTGCP